MIDFLKNSLVNYPGWRTNRKIIVFESDDWGSIRMPDLNTFNKLKQRGINVDKSVYCRFDTIESNEDLERLFDTLNKFKDINGNHPCITANTVVGNPDFIKINQSNLSSYFYESFVETLKGYSNRERVYDLYKEGISNKMFYPQFHGREHVQVGFWFELLKTNENFKFAFDNRLWGLSKDVFPELKKSVQATYDTDDFEFIKESLISGLNLFEKIFGFRSVSIIANNFIWDSSINPILKENGVEFIQGMKYQIFPKRNNEKRQKVFHYTGEINNLGQTYLVRNCNFEPSITGLNINKTINEISNAFFWHKPAIISTHRINFIGSLQKSNRENNLIGLENLIKLIIKKWPNAEFISSAQLGHLITL